MKLRVALSIGALFIATAARAQQPPSGSFQSYGNSGSSPSQPGYVRPMPNGGYIVQPPASAPTYTPPNGESVTPENPSNTYQNSYGGGSAQPEAPSGPERSGTRQ